MAHNGHHFYGRNRQGAAALAAAREIQRQKREAEEARYSEIKSLVKELRRMCSEKQTLLILDSLPDDDQDFLIALRELVAARQGAAVEA